MASPLRAESTPVRARLRRDTSRLHDDLEARLDLLAPDLSQARYVRVLRALLDFHEPLEPRLFAALGASPVAACPRVALLERDLLALGETREQLARAPRCADLPPLSDAAQGAGCLYVIEGARLGGRVLAPVVGGRLGVTAERGCAFFSGAHEPPGRWPTVVRWLEGQDPADVERIADAACDTFRALARWLDAQGALR